jgi:1-acyl-sn-glycerol-3-phosphate acyltransferase
MFPHSIGYSSRDNTMNKFLSVLYAIYFFVAALLWVPVAFVLWAISPLVDKQRRLLNTLTGRYMFNSLTISPYWTFTYEGTENLAEGGPYILVANHQSLADIVAVYGLDYPLRWVAKTGIFRVPFLGWIMSLNGHVQLSKGDLSSTRLMLRQCADWLDQGISISMFPEGTRSLNGEIGQFHSGPFWLAKYANVPIVPIAIDGTFEMLPKNTIELNFHSPVLVRVLPPVSAAQFGGDTEKFKQYVHSEIAEALAEMRGRSTPVVAAPRSLRAS